MTGVQTCALPIYLRSPEEAKAYLTELKLLLSYIGVSDCNMQEGSLRVDANVNLHVPSPRGPLATPIVEIKNMNSFRAVERALAFEAARQYQVWQETGQKLGDVPKQTRGWDDQAQVTRAQRHKEESSDYRYFPDPDLVPVRVTPAEIDAARAALGELPAALRDRLVATYALDRYDADVLVNQGQPLVDYFEQVAAQCQDPKRASNWIQQDVLRTLHERGISIAEFSVAPPVLAELLRMVRSGELDTTRVRQVLQQMVDTGSDLATAVAALGIAQVSAEALATLCRELLAANPKIVADVKSGKQQALGALIGQARKRNPNADPTQVRTVCAELIKEM